ncbi:MAG: hypothetical protein M3M96_10410 [Candidatus Eremiobacteraeota bacterium]|nr:hypothetical protein [Candidatus Eremiobacteraeota bacterium]
MIHHIDAHVRSLAGPKRLFDALMPSFARTRVVSDSDGVTYYAEDKTLPFFGLILDADHKPGTSRTAFAAPSRAGVDVLAAIASANGAESTDGPAACPEYGPNYYAFFFEDSSANKYEICFNG